MGSARFGVIRRCLGGMNLSRILAHKSPAGGWLSVEARDKNAFTVHDGVVLGDDPIA